MLAFCLKYVFVFLIFILIGLVLIAEYDYNFNLFERKYNDENENIHSLDKDSSIIKFINHEHETIYHENRNSVNSKSDYAHQGKKNIPSPIYSSYLLEPSIILNTSKDFWDNLDSNLQNSKVDIFKIPKFSPFQKASLKDITDLEDKPKVKHEKVRKNLYDHKVKSIEIGKTISRNNISEAISLCHELLSLIRYRYQLNEDLGKRYFLISNNMRKHTWEVMKYKFSKKIIGSLMNKNEEFLMIFGGSNLTAGYDNYFNQSYPAIVDKRMSPVLSAMGIKLEVHNIAQGANPCNPYSLCYEAMGGKDADWIGWENAEVSSNDEGL